MSKRGNFMKRASKHQGPFQEGQWLSINDVVVALIGQYNKSVADLITRFAKEDTPKVKGLSAFPQDLVRRSSERSRGKQRFEYCWGSRLKLFLENLLFLDVLLAPKDAALVLKGKADSGSVKSSLEKTATTVELRSSHYATWSANIAAILQHLDELLSIDPRKEKYEDRVARLGGSGIPFDAKKLQLMKQLETIDKKNWGGER